jgi:hypothetical protein
MVAVAIWATMGSPQASLASICGAALKGNAVRNHDFASAWFLAVTGTGLVLLCSSLLVFAFS